MDCLTPSPLHVTRQEQAALLLAELRQIFRGDYTAAVQFGLDFFVRLRKLLNISNLELVVAAGVEPDTRLENTQVIDPENARIGMIAPIAKLTVRSLYGHFQNVRNSQTPPLDGPYSQKEHSEVRQ